MGLYDYVNFKMPCPTCGFELDSFQTKDLGCDLVCYDPTELRNFYDECFRCGTWVEFYRSGHIPQHEVRLTPFTKAEVEVLGFTMSTKDKL